MPTLKMTKGLPASGKTTYAKELVKQGWKRVNKDDLRAMVDDSRWSKANENIIFKTRDNLIRLYLGEGLNVVVDDTNLADKHELHLLEIAREYKADFEIYDLTNVSVDECIARDKKRQNYVGEKVIHNMYRQFLKPKIEPYKPDADLPLAIICDIDGTLAHMDGRSPYDWKRVGEDKVDEEIRGILALYRLFAEIIIVSGRDGSCVQETKDWLSENGIDYDALYMRSANDSRKDNIVKREIFDNHIRDQYNIRFVLDDRNQVVEMWRDLGLKCYQVADGDF